MEVETLSGPELLGAIRKVLKNPSYRERARYFQDVIAADWKWLPTGLNRQSKGTSFLKRNEIIRIQRENY